MTLWNRILIIIGAEICEHCGSANVQQMGYEERGHRHYCHDCQETTWVS